jgi:predicted PurR-regulated permease PerM
MAEQPIGCSGPEGVPKVGLWISLSVLAAGALVLAVLFYQMVRPLAVPLFFAAVVAMLVQPIHRRFDGRRNVPTWLSAAVVTVCSLVVIVGPLIAVICFGFDKLHGAVAGLDARNGRAAADATVSSGTGGQFDSLLAQVSRSLGADSERVRTALAGSGRDLEQALFARSLEVLGSIPRILLSVILFAVAVFFLLKDGPQVAQAWDE